MKGSPPLNLHVDQHARPVAVHQAAQVPLHWQDAVKGGLDMDVRLGVIEKFQSILQPNGAAGWLFSLNKMANHAELLTIKP
jgi:hypothetical protein